ncbi:UNVERIFIED_CONTAM: era [Trichonephila clavipes]
MQETFRIFGLYVAVIINKVDKSSEEEVKAKIEFWKNKINPDVIFPISALLGYNVESVMQYIKDKLPEHPAYYAKDELTDKNMRFFVSEIIREKVFKLYEKEIPYSTEIIITSFKEEPKLTRIAAEIIVERDSQKNIIIGKAGAMIKKVGTYARQDIEEFIGGKVFLELFVKVIPDWRRAASCPASLFQMFLDSLVNKGETMDRINT